MRHRLTGALLSGLGIALAGPALADKAIIAECRGNGAAFYLSDVPFDRVNDLAVEKGIGPAPSADAVFVIGDGRRYPLYSWDTRSRQAALCCRAADRVYLSPDSPSPPYARSMRSSCTEPRACSNVVRSMQRHLSLGDVALIAA